ncbi:hypothetical protein ACJQWK_01784 [Exserohilum turcicum]
MPLSGFAWPRHKNTNTPISHATATYRRRPSYSVQVTQPHNPSATPSPSSPLPTQQEHFKMQTQSTKHKSFLLYSAPPLKHHNLLTAPRSKQRNFPPPLKYSCIPSQSGFCALFQHAASRRC